jgi:peptidoglycan hydrolase-like protein with peptidoglycan-binding domain
MNSKTISTTCFTLVFGLLLVPQVHATDISASLARMDAIIKEMQTLRDEFAKLSAVTVTPAVQPSGSVLGTQANSFFTQKLELGETNSDIKKIQKLLATDKEIYPYGVASGMFGPKTEEAIKNLQSRFGLNPVGVVGPATRELLELFIAAYPDDMYPADVLKKKPTVLGASTNIIPVTPVVPTPGPTTPVISGALKALSSMIAEYDNGDATVKIKYTNGTSETIDIEADSKMGVIDQLAAKTGQKKATILGVIEFRSGDARNDGDEEDQAQEALDDAEDAIDDVQSEIDDADSDVDTSDAEDLLDEADDLLDDAQDAFDDEDYEDALDLAQEAEDMADEAADELEDAIDDAA